MQLDHRQKTLLILIAVLLLCIGGALIAIHYLQPDRPAAATLVTGGILIDPGHGGADVGATGANGSVEADMNLAVAQKLKLELESRGIPVTLTRETPDALGDSKEADMKKRGKLIQTSTAAAFVSIHMNSYPEDPAVSGPQVFYDKSSVIGKDFANAMQPYLNKATGGTRKPNSLGLFVLQAAEGVMPGVLVECGFLTNPTEEQKLLDEDYQNTLAVAIADGILAYCGA
ncbi:MAG: N-acetylmuramoyl-L-alanine amidase [Eubacteriales bacterium]|nr:N-acetylmuramoyl-L-alanine amidase [Eubacteriales bacterium]